MRVCPTVDGNAAPLITHRIGVDTCLSRQQCNYHKCHRCIYRGKAASWEPLPQAGEPVVEMTSAGARGVPTAKVPVPRKKAARSKPAKTKEPVTT